MWILLPAVFLLSLLDWCLFFLYQKKFHFWVGIVEEDGAVDELESDDDEVCLKNKVWDAYSIIGIFLVPCSMGLEISQLPARNG